MLGEVRRIPASASRNYVRALHSTSSSYSSQLGRTAIYRRIGSLSQLPSRSSQPLFSTFLQEQLPPILGSTPVRFYHSSPTLRQQAGARQQTPQESSDSPQSEVKDPPRPEAEPEKSSSGPKSEGDEPEGEQKEGGEKKEKKADAPPPPHGDKTPWQVFRETLNKEFEASKEWNESTKQLAGEVQDFRESERLRKAKEVYNATGGRAVNAAGQVISGAAKATGKGAQYAWESTPVQGVRKGVNAAGRGIETATRPIRESEAFRSIQESMDDGNSLRYGGWSEKEERRMRRAARDRRDGYKPVEAMEEDVNAGTGVVLHKDSAFREAWNNFKEKSKLGQTLSNMRSTYEESENPLISTARSIGDRIAGFFVENETAMVIKKFKEMDPTFKMEPFLRDMREYVLPEVLDAYVKGDLEVLKEWLSAAQFQVYSTLMEQSTKAGLRSDGKIVDLRGVDVLNARLLEPGEIPVFILTCRTQEVHVFRNIKTGELAAGMEDRVQQVTYAIGMTRLPEDMNNPETRGWRMIELQKAARDYL